VRFGVYSLGDWHRQLGANQHINKCPAIDASHAMLRLVDAAIAAVIRNH